MQSFKDKQGAIRKASSMINANKQRKTIKWERIEISSRKLQIPREHFMQNEHNKSPKEDRKGGGKKQRTEQTNRK